MNYNNYSKLFNQTNTIDYDDGNNKNNNDGPLIIFIIIVFFAMVTLIGVKTYKIRPPSVLTMTTLCFAAIISCFALMTVRIMSVYTEWFLLIVLVLAFMFCISSYMDPNIFFYDRTS